MENTYKILNVFKSSAFNVFECLFFIALFVWIAASVLHQTSLSSLIPSEIKLVKLSALGVIFLAEVLSRYRYTLIDGIQIIAVMLLGIGAFFSDNSLLFQAFVIIFCARRFLIKRTLTIFSWSIILSIIIVLILSEIGTIESVDLNESASRPARSSMGFVWPSRLPTFYLTIVIAYGCIKQEKCSLPLLFVMFFIGFVIYLITDSRNPFLFTILAIVCFAFIGIRNRKKSYRISNALIRALALTIPLLLCFSILLPLAYDPSSSQWLAINELLAERLNYSSLALENTQLSLFGLPDIANQDSATAYINGYFDSGYLVLLYGYGIIPCFIILAGFMYIIIRAANSGNYYVVASTLIVVTFSFFYAHMFTNLCYNALFFYIPYYLLNTKDTPAEEKQVKE